MLYTVWVAIVHMGRVGCMGHSGCYCVHTLADWMDDGLVMRPPQLKADRFPAEDFV